MISPLGQESTIQEEGSTLVTSWTEPGAVKTVLVSISMPMLRLRRSQTRAPWESSAKGPVFILIYISENTIIKEGEDMLNKEGMSPQEASNEGIVGVEEQTVPTEKAVESQGEPQVTTPVVSVPEKKEEVQVSGVTDGQPQVLSEEQKTRSVEEIFNTDPKSGAFDPKKAVNEINKAQE